MGPSSPKPVSASSMSESVRASPSGWTSTPTTAICTTAWLPPSVLPPAKTPSKYAPAAASATSTSTAHQRKRDDRDHHHPSVGAEGERPAPAGAAAGMSGSPCGAGSLRRASGPTPTRKTVVSGAAVEAAGVCKSFGETVVLDGIDLTVEAGTIF